LTTAGLQTAEQALHNSSAPELLQANWNPMPPRIQISESRMLRICSGYDTEPYIAHILKGILKSRWGKAEDIDLHKLAGELRVKAGNRTTNADLTIS
jgi:hypothetical protein